MYINVRFEQNQTKEGENMPIKKKFKTNKSSKCMKYYLSHFYLNLYPLDCGHSLILAYFSVSPLHSIYLFSFLSCVLWKNLKNNEN